MLHIQLYSSRITIKYWKSVEVSLCRTNVYIIHSPDNYIGMALQSAYMGNLERKLGASKKDPDHQP